MLRNHDVNVLAENNKKRRGNVAAITEKHGSQNQQQKIIKAEDSNEQLADEPKAKRMCKRAVSSSTLTVKELTIPMRII